MDTKIAVRDQAHNVIGLDFLGDVFWVTHSLIQRLQCRMLLSLVRVSFLYMPIYPAAQPLKPRM